PRGLRPLRPPAAAAARDGLLALVPRDGPGLLPLPPRDARGTGGGLLRPRPDAAGPDQPVEERRRIRQPRLGDRRRPRAIPRRLLARPRSRPRERDGRGNDEESASALLLLEAIRHRPRPPSLHRDPDRPRRSAAPPAPPRRRHVGDLRPP